jgi:hypothetical protein
MCSESSVVAPPRCFTAAGQWLYEHQNSATLLGTDYDVQDADGDGESDAVVRLAILLAKPPTP